MIKNIIFDIGGVLLEYNPKTYLDKLNIEEGKSKPNIEIYQNLINKYQINVKETIFIDDTNKNIISANKLGFQTILFNDIGQLKLLEL